MKSLRFLDRRAGYSLGAIGLLLGMVAPTLIPAFASASLVTSRSIELSSSAANQANVTYKVTFTPDVAGSPGYVTLIFCNDSPIPGQTCTAPTGFNIASAAVDTANSTDNTAAVVGTPTANTIAISSALVHNTAVTITLTGIHNPTNATTSSTGLYGRIETFDTQAHATAGQTPATLTGLQDDGGVALAITNTIGVTATVKESMTFCVAGNVSMNASGPSGNCGVDANGGSATGLDTTDINLILGHGSPAALDSSQVDTASDWAQISTNASLGAVVRMTNTNGGSCNGLWRTGAGATCDIAGVGNSAAAIGNGSGLFGMLLGTPGPAPFSVATPSGTITPTAPYTGASGNYGMGTGTNTTYGDPIFDTGSQPIADQNIKLTFAASAAPTTPAGIYQATMNLIATGIF